MAGDGGGNGLDEFLVAVGTPAGIAAMFLNRLLDFANVHLLDNAHRFRQGVQLTATVWALAVSIVKGTRQLFGKIRITKMARMSRLGTGFPVGWGSGRFHQVR